MGAAEVERPLGLPARALTIGTDRTLEACARRWWFRKVEGLRPLRDGAALNWGTAWDAVLQDVHNWWMFNDGAPYPAEAGIMCIWCKAGEDPGCPHCGDTGQGPVVRAGERWRETDEAHLMDALQSCLDGWLRVHGHRPPEGWRVVAVQLALAMPIFTMGARAQPFPTAIYTPDAWVLTRADGSHRLARTGEARNQLPEGWTAVKDRMQAWLSVRLDCLWEGPRKQLIVGEWKSSADPARYMMGLSVDPQVTLYEMAVEYAVKEGLLWLPGPNRRGGIVRGQTVAGWWYDVASSHPHRDPTELKPKKEGDFGGFSVAKNNLANVPSWRLEAALVRRGVPLTDVATKEGATWGDLVEDARFVDQKLYLRESGASPPDEKERARRELYAVARRAASLHRAAAEMRRPEDVDVSFPRTPICRLPGGSCAFRGPCVRDSEGARENYKVADEEERVWLDLYHKAMQIDV